ncbi:ankyrin repeat domain-containing protein [Aspergillus neoniger CBS 115656]|uniref:Ankyrin n=1 Tax=Aspergillus neoniger (strain CBS 115656) TaxID=1448310 RepID=A0A318Y9E0_ASPNB|nr:ankyrin [Aspergillus neoniger CBS 115656]PYH30916.1 ankyrin [Aspergillus neoniger CBS 115656]
MACYPRIPYPINSNVNSQLIGWTRVGNLTAVTAILDSPEAVDLPRSGETALHEAIKSNRPDFLRYLIPRGFDVNQKGIEPYGEVCLTPLHLVAASNSAEMVDILLNAGADATLDDVSADGMRGVLGDMDSEPQTPFMAAAFWGSHAIGSREWPLAVTAAALYRHPKTLDVLLHNYPAPGVPQDILDRDLADAAENEEYDPYHGIIPALPEESWSRGIETFRLLLARGARPNAQPPVSIYASPWTEHKPIIHTTIDTSMGLAMVKMLVDHDVDLPDGSGGGAGGISLFARAVRNGDPDLIRYFYEREGAIIDMNEELPETNDSPGGSLLHAAAGGGRLATVQFLLDHGADPSMMNTKGWLPVHQACHGRHLDIIKLLWPFTCPADVADLTNYRTKDGHIAFHLTNCWLIDDEDQEVKAHSTRLLHFFVEKGTDLSSLDRYGKNMLHYTLPQNENMFPWFRTLMQAGAQDLVGPRFLLAQGADKDINSQDNKGRTPLYYYIQTHYYQPGNQPATFQIRAVVLDLLMEAGADPDIRADSGKSSRDLLIEKGFPYDFDK